MKNECVNGAINTIPLLALVAKLITFDSHFYECNIEKVNQQQQQQQWEE